LFKTISPGFSPKAIVLDRLEVRHALLAVEGIFLLRGLGFVEVSADEQKSVLLHARDIVAALLAKRRACPPDIS
jgi:hypothetical protein